MGHATKLAVQISELGVHKYNSLDSYDSSITYISAVFVAIFLEFSFNRKVDSVKMKQNTHTSCTM